MREFSTGGLKQSKKSKIKNQDGENAPLPGAYETEVVWSAGMAVNPEDATHTNQSITCYHYQITKSGKKEGLASPGLESFLSMTETGQRRSRKLCNSAIA